MVKLQENDGVHTVTLPKDAVNLFGWVKGDQLVAIPQIERKGILLMRVDNQDEVKVEG